MDTPHHDPRCFVVIGAGQAGAWVARTLRSEGFAGRVVLIGEERHAPYERPPLSKAVLKGEAPLAAATLLAAEEAAGLGIEMRLGCRVAAIDRGDRAVLLEDGGRIGYDRLFLTTGARVRRLPLPGPVEASPRVHVLRSADDAARLGASLAPGLRLAVIGGGWIGLEVAATARPLGLSVTVVEAGERLCARSVPSPVSQFLASLHDSNGVSVLLGAPPQDFTATDDTIAFTVGGREVVADHVVIGIGAIPNVELAEAAGLAIQNGILVDDVGRTSDPAIFAAGDVAAHPNRLLGGIVRLESWANAQNQAIVAARAALDQPVAYHEVPWIWSDQFGCNVQIVGAPERGVEIRHEPSAGADGGCWTAIDAEGQVIGAVAANAPRLLRPVRKALMDRLAALASEG